MSAHENVKYFDLHTQGLGYVNQVREVIPENGEPFLSVSIAALSGNVENVQHTYFECIVAGQEARATIRQVKSAVEGKLKVLMGFTLSDLRADTFVFKSGAKAGETGVSLHARLLRVHWVKVDGQPFMVQQEHVA